MEKKTNKAKLEIFKFFEKISFIARHTAHDKMEVIMFSPANFIENMLIRVFLHAEFISVMKSVQNPTIFVKNAKE